MEKKKERAWWITAIIVAVVVTAIALFIEYANGILRQMVNEQLTEQVRNLKNVTVSYEDIDVNLWKGSAYVKNLRYCSNPDNVLYDSVPGFIVEAKMTQFQFVGYLTYMRTKNISIGKVRTTDVVATVNYGQPDTIVQSKSNVKLVEAKGDSIILTHDTLNNSQISISKAVLAFVAAINVNNVVVENGSLRFRAINSPLEADCDSLYLTVRNLGYDFANEVISYNDSVYECSIKNIRFVQPDGKYTLTVKELYSKNTENITIKGIRHVCNIPKEKLAVVNGKIPSVWSDLSIDEVKTSKVNIVRSVIDAKIKIDSVNVTGGTVSLYKDDLFPPVKVQRPFQALLAELAVPLDIKKVHIKLDRFHFTMISSVFTKASTMHMNNLDIVARRISNVDPRDIVAMVKGSMDGGGGHMTLNLRLLKDPKCTWRERIIFENSNLAAFNGFLNDLVGVKVGGKLSRMECYAVGDSMTANGNFVMEYTGLDAEILKGRSPIKALQKNTKALNGIVKIVIPPSNPRKAGEAPKKYNVKGKRNLYSPYMVYLLSPMFDGLKETMLAPFYLNKEIKPDKKEKRAERRAEYKEKKAERRAERAERRAERKNHGSTEDTDSQL